VDRRSNRPLEGVASHGRAAVYRNAFPWGGLSADTLMFQGPVHSLRGHHCSVLLCWMANNEASSSVWTVIAA
jgi:hypothetical protein